MPGESKRDRPFNRRVKDALKNLKAPKRPSANFSWGEVIANSGYPAVPSGPVRLPNGSTVRPRRNARIHARNLERLRAQINKERRAHGLPACGIRFTSWARSWGHNQEVGGAVGSQHLYFLATDIAREEVRRLCPWKGGGQDFDRIAGNVFSGGGFGTYPGGARHVDSRGHRARWSDWVGWRAR